MGFICHFRHLPRDVSLSSPTTLSPDLRRNNRLTTVADMHVLDRNDLTATGSSSLQGKQGRLVRRR